MANLGIDLMLEKGSNTVLLDVDGMFVGLEPLNQGFED
jgi:hypothetical protein